MTALYYPTKWLSKLLALTSNCCQYASIYIYIYIYIYIKSFCSLSAFSRIFSSNLHDSSLYSPFALCVPRSTELYSLHRASTMIPDLNLLTYLKVFGVLPLQRHPSPLSGSIWFFIVFSILSLIFFLFTVFTNIFFLSYHCFTYIFLFTVLHE